MTRLNRNNQMHPQKRSNQLYKVAQNQKNQRPQMPIQNLPQARLQLQAQKPQLYHLQPHRRPPQAKHHPKLVRQKRSQRVDKQEKWKWIKVDQKHELAPSSILDTSVLFVARNSQPAAISKRMLKRTNRKANSIVINADECKFNFSPIFFCSFGKFWNEKK